MDVLSLPNMNDPYTEQVYDRSSAAGGDRWAVAAHHRHHVNLAQCIRCQGTMGGPLWWRVSSHPPEPGMESILSDARFELTNYTFISLVHYNFTSVCTSKILVRNVSSILLLNLVLMIYKIEKACSIVADPHFGEHQQQNVSVSSLMQLILV